MSTAGVRTRPRPSGERVVAMLDRPEVVLQAVPLGAVYVILTQLAHSRGTTGPGGTIALCCVLAWYLATSVTLAVDPRWARTSRSIAVIAPAVVSSVLAAACLVDPLPPMTWSWLVPPVLMMAAYICRTRDLVVVGALVSAGGVALFAASGVDPREHTWFFALLVLLWLLPCVLTRRVLGNLSQAEDALQELTSRDPLTRVLNRRGLEESYGRLVDRLGRADPEASLSVLVVDLDDVRAVAERYGHTAADRALVRTAEVLARAHRRDHLVARLRGTTFVVVTSHDPRQVGAALASAVRRVNAEPALTASVGAVGDVPVRLAPPERLAGLVLLAERALAEVRAGGGDAVLVHPYEADAPLPGPVDVVLPPPGRALAAPRGPELRGRDADTPLFGVGLVVLAVLVVLLPQSATGATGGHVAAVTGCSLLAAGGVFAWAGWLRGTLVHVGAVLLALAMVALAVVTGDSTLSRVAALALVPYPLYLASLTLPRATAAWLLLLLPGAAAGAVLGPGPGHLPGDRNVIFAGLVCLSLLTCALALWVRRVRDVIARRMMAASRTDAATGVLSRQGLLEHYRALPAGTPMALVYVDVDGMAGVNEQVGQHGGDTVLRRVGAALVEAAGEAGAAARVGGDEFVVLLAAPARSSGFEHRLRARLAGEQTPVSVSLGRADDVVGEETSLWRLMARADEALLLDRARDRRSAPGRPTRPRSPGR